MKDFREFVLEYADADTARLLLSCREWPEPPVRELAERTGARNLAANTLEARRKLRRKVPQWYARPELVYPDVLCAEQCSSAETARYKADLATGIASGPSSGTPGHSPAMSASPGVRGLPGAPAATAGGPRIADLTGGLGVDSWAFSRIAEQVLYNEMDPALAAAAKYNFACLGCGGILVSNRELAPGNLAGILGSFVPDVIFLDPSRRAPDGRKVFLPEDCRPDVLTLLPELFSVCRHLLLKLSPMADITLLVKRLGEAAQGACLPGNPVREIHVVATGGECRELLLWLDRECTEACSVICCESGSTLTFKSSEEREASARLLTEAEFARMTEAQSFRTAKARPEDPRETFRYLFEPGRSLTKGGLFNALGDRFGLVKLGLHTHLYLAEASSERLERFGNIFRINEIHPLDKRTVKAIGKRFPNADVTARNIPMTSEELAKRLKVAPGSGVHLFGVRIDFTSTAAVNYLLVCSRTDEF